MKKYIALFALIFFQSQLKSQTRFLDAAEVESWPKQKVIVSEDYNRISTYLYLLNKQKLLDLFTGVEYTKEEREELGINEFTQPKPLQAALTSALSLISVGVLPLLVSIFARLKLMIAN